MEQHSALTDSEFEEQFSNLTLDQKIFTHEAHLRLAWIQITRYGVVKAIDNICDQIKVFANHHGDHDKFNVTVTVAAVRAVNHFILKSKSSNFEDFMMEFPALKTKFKELIDSHYSIDIFKSELAKKEFIDPDKEPFDQLSD